jgi:type IV pilus modification protein PilV
MKASRKRPSGREAGFSLIEIMVAMTFLAIGLLAIAQLIPAGMRGLTEARVRTNAVQTGQRIMDGLRATDYDSLDAGEFSQTDGRYTSNWTITDNDPVSGMRRVDLVTAWGDSNQHTMALSTYLTRNH